jgi:hypothetical protein
MGPVDIFFLILVAIWGAIGIVRGHHRELGVTLLLFIGLFVLLFIDSQFSQQVDELLEFIAGPDPCKQAVVQALASCAFLIFIVFIAYQGEIFRYPGTTNNSFLSWLVGLLNGYLFAGSIWYYLAQAQWPFNLVQPPYSQVYTAIYTILPPAIFRWQYLIALIIIMIILRVIK